jgi:hypothetical protein
VVKPKRLFTQLSVLLFAQMRALVNSEALSKACPVPFDEGLLWSSGGSEPLKHELRTAFHNITRMLDCVGCEKCKMHGKLNILGIASAMKVGGPGANWVGLGLKRLEYCAACV